MRRRATASGLMATLAAMWLASTSATTPLEVGVDICFCQPSVYVFTLDFGLECDDRNLVNNSTGIEEAICSVLDANQTIPADPFPVSVSKFLITELDENFDPFSDQLIEGNYVSGDQIDFVSSIQMGPPQNATEVKGLLMQITGVNAAGEEITNSWALLYNNNCQDYPVLVNGDQIGWTVLVSQMIIYYLCAG